LKGIILSAGQGRRLLPLTTDLPKCLLRIGGHTVLAWQLRMLAAAGIHHVVVVVGFGAVEVERHLADIAPPKMKVRTIFNELYDRADNIVSCAVASPEMGGDFLLLNGDTLAESAVLVRMLASPKAPVVMAVARKDEYDADDMKVSCLGGRVIRVGKDLAAAETHGEAIGFSLYRGRGPALFAQAIEEILDKPEGSQRWYLSAVNLLAGRGQVHSVGVHDARWAEIDYLHDLPRAHALVSSLAEQPRLVGDRVWGRSEGSGSWEEPSLRALPLGSDR
jgi:choline kinase